MCSQCSSCCATASEPPLPAPPGPTLPLPRSLTPGQTTPPQPGAFELLRPPSASLSCSPHLERPFPACGAPVSLGSEPVPSPSSLDERVGHSGLLRVASWSTQKQPMVFLAGPLGPGALSTVNPTRGGHRVRPSGLPTRMHTRTWPCGTRRPKGSSDLLGRVPGLGLTSHLSARARAPGPCPHSSLLSGP